MAERKVPVTLSHRAPGLQPPVYVAGSFSNPQWIPLPMEYTHGEDGVYTFTKTFEVEPNSKIAYKYRVGEGDWWVLNEDAPTTTDEAGNRNNFLEAPELPEVTEAAETARSEEQGDSADPAVKPTELNKDDTHHVTSDDARETQPLPTIEALRQPEHIDRWNTSTPEIAAEVADSAVLLDRTTPEPEPLDEATAQVQPQEPPAVTDIAEKAAEADIAAEVADTAETLDVDEPESRPKTDTTEAAPTQDPAEVAAEVADTAELLDADEPKIHQETTSPAHQSLVDVKSDVKDESLDIAGYSNEPEPVPLFAHECAGLYEDDEIPGAEDAEGSGSTNGTSHKHDEDFEDPTLERFPSNKDEIISTVRKVGTGLNADQTAVEGVPPSPIFKSRTSSGADFPGDHSDEPNSPTSARGQQSLGLSSALLQQSLNERSVSAASLHSIAEGVEGEEHQDSKAEEIAPLVEKAETADEAIQVAKEAEGEVNLTPQKPSLAPLVTVPSPSTKPTTGLLSPVSDEDEAVVLRNGKGKGKSAESGYLTPERAATPKPEEPGSPREPPPNTADPDPVVDRDIGNGESNLDLAPGTLEPRSPQIVVSEPATSQPEEELLPASSLDKSDAKENSDVGTSQTNGVAEENESIEGGANSKDDKTVSARREQGTSAHSEAAATTSALEENQSGSLKKRSVARPNPTDRTDTPNSISDPHREAAKSGNWFSAFFRLIFIDLVGGFVSRLCGGRRKTLVTTVVVVSALGFAAWRRYSGAGFLVA